MVVTIYDKDCTRDCNPFRNVVSGRVALVQSRITSAAAKITASKATVLFHSLSSLLLLEENSPVDVARDAVQCCRDFHECDEYNFTTGVSWNTDFMQ